MPTLHWIGKDKIINHHQEVPYKVLNHEYGFSENGKTNTTIDSGNLIINGDNLEALKALLPKYENKVNCIYIDPPYNTGNENWVYNDNVNSPQIKKWLGKVVGKESEDLTRHDKWLCMMYPRLKLLHKLLAKDGAIFISIDDNEQANLKLMMDEIFGGGNFISEIVWKGKGGGADNKYLMVAHEYIVVYAKNKNIFKIGEEEKEGEVFSKFDETQKRYYKTQLARKWGSNSRRTDRPNLFYSILSPNNENVFPILPNGDDGCWRWSKQKMENEIKNGNIEFVLNQDNTWIVYEKIYQPIDGEFNTKKYSTWFDDYGNTALGSKELKQIFENKVFDYPKPKKLLEALVQISGKNKNSIILDSFAGSGTTAHAVLNLNKQDGGNRKFILIEMENYAETITAERVKRVIKGYADKEGTGGSFDYYTLGEPLFDDNNNLNESVETKKIREYIWFTETRIPFNGIDSLSKGEGQTEEFLGIYNHTAYYFIYQKEQLTTLDYEALATHIQHKAERYIIYADNCLLPETFMREKNIEFKKIPRDITRF